MRARCTKRSRGTARRSDAASPRRSTADLVCICEPDGTFDPADLLKLLPFTVDVDVVFGSRTVQTFILHGANMGAFLRWGNWAVAKLAMVLFNSVHLSDVGCTFRVLSRDAIDQLQPEFERNDASFGFEMMLHVLERRSAVHPGAGEVPCRGSATAPSPAIG